MQTTLRPPTRARLQEESPPTGAPDWFVTYADLMSLLLTFFIMLAAMSDARNEPRVAQAVEAMHKQFGPDRNAAFSLAPPRGARTEGPPGRSPLVKTVRSGEPAVAGGVLLFEEDSAEIGDAAREEVRFIHQQFQGKLQKIEVRGHTTRRPLPSGSPYADHWALAYARCRAVADLLVSFGTDPKRIRLSAAAGYEPAYTGDDVHRRRENSRVEVFLLNEFVVHADRADPAAGVAAPASGTPGK